MTAARHPASSELRFLWDGGRPVYPVTRRQVEALTHAANGRTNAGIAARMGISENTVSGLLRKAFVKLGASDRAQAVAVALRLGLVPLEAVVLPEAVSASRDAA